MSWKRLEDVLKTHSHDEYIGFDQDVFWRRKAKANIFVLIKTSSRRLHQDECLLGTVVLTLLTFGHTHCLHLMYAEVTWVLVSLGTQVQSQIILDPDYLLDYLSISYDYGKTKQSWKGNIWKFLFTPSIFFTWGRKQCSHTILLFLKTNVKVFYFMFLDKKKSI